MPPSTPAVIHRWYITTYVVQMADGMPPSVESMTLYFRHTGNGTETPAEAAKRGFDETFKQGDAYFTGKGMKLYLLDVYLREVDPKLVPYLETSYILEHGSTSREKKKKQNTEKKPKGTIIAIVPTKKKDGKDPKDPSDDGSPKK